MVREAIKGMESSRFAERARHQTILPFTRYLVGGADYTTMVFNQRRGDRSWANQIASLAIFDRPLLTIAANPQTILTNAAVDVIKTIPAVWDETVVLPDSEIGELAAYARRTGDKWFLAVMCGPQPKTLQVPLSFLGDGQYKASFVRDGENDTSGLVENLPGKRSESLTLSLRAGGGFIGRFSRN